ncbi:MAG: hypothetical protein HZA78_06350 [Candidatus Schekmanbacteria bacterium]|nr:hypothetical protein [Candidatus Schekmanbacteria bacterium]
MNSERKPVVCGGVFPLILPLTVLVSYLTAFLIWILRDKPAQIHNRAAVGSALINLALVLCLLPGIWREAAFSCNLFTFIPSVDIAFRVDGLGYLFALIASFYWLLTAIYSVEYMRNDKFPARYWFFLFLCMGSVLGIAFAANLFTLFLFYEILTICTYPLIVHAQTPQAIKAGRKYLVYSMAGGTALMLSLVITYLLCGHLDFRPGGILPDSASYSILRLLFITFMVGFGVKSVIFPLHGWLPDAMIAPTPVSAILHAVAVVKAGVYGILRIVIDIFGLQLLQKLHLNEWLLALAGITIIGGSLMALRQTNLKKMLAYSTISQLSYIILGVVMATPSGIIGGILQMLYQSVMKISLFFCAGAIYRQTGVSEIADMGGLGEKIPLTMFAFSIAALGTIGFPGTAGFISKWYLAMGAMEAGRFFMVGVIISGTLLNAGYYLPLLYKAFFQESLTRQKGQALSLLMTGPCLLTAGLVLALGLCLWVHKLPLHLAQNIAEGVLYFKCP